MWNELIDQIKSLIDNISEIQESYIFEKEQFSGTPACTITPSENESDYETNRENERIYAFNIKLYVNRTVAPSGNDVDYYADERMRDIVDKILDKVDKNYNLTGINNPTGYTFINLFAIPSIWGYAGRESEYRAAQISVRARVLIDINNI